MPAILSGTIKPDAGSMLPLHAVLAAVRRSLPATAAVQRDELIGLLSDAGYRFAFVAGTLHVSGARLAA